MEEVNMGSSMMAQLDISSLRTAHVEMTKTTPYQEYCVKNMSNEELGKLIEILNPIVYPEYRFFFGVLPLPLAIIATGCTLAYALAVSYALKQHRVSRKCYVLLLNRAIGDLLCCSFFFLTSIYLFSVSKETFKVQILRVIATFGASCYWSVMVSYVSLSFLKLFAVYQPIRFKKSMTMSRCIRMICLSWVIYILMLIYTFSMIAFVINPRLRKFSLCQRETCINVMTQTKEILFISLYSFTLIAFGLTVYMVRRRTNQSSMMREKDFHVKQAKMRFPLWKLTLNVSTFAVFNLIYVCKVVFMTVYDVCYIPIYHPEMVRLFGCIWTTLLVRILLDAVFGFVTDKKIRDSLFHAINPTASAPSRGREQSETISRSTIADRFANKPFSSMRENRTSPYRKREKMDSIASM